VRWGKIGLKIETKGFNSLESCNCFVEEIIVRFVEEFFWVDFAEKVLKYEVRMCW
jgi:hypothetical protein